MTLKILISEDNEYTALQYSRILEKNGHNVIVTRDGEECLKKYNEISPKTEFDSLDNSLFDLVLIDNNMPKKTGIEVIREIKEKNPNQRIILASAYNVESLQNVPDSMTKDIEIIGKPFSLNTLLHLVESK